MKSLSVSLGIFLSIFVSSLLAEDLVEYKNTCTAIGFKAGTEKFGDCVLQLRKKDLEKKPTGDNQSINKSDSQRKSDSAAREELKRRKEADDAAYEAAKRKREADDERLLRLREQELEAERQSAKAQADSAATQQKMFECQNARTNMQEQCNNASQYPSSNIYAITCGVWRGRVMNLCN
jgi:hypothetical protein